MLLKILLQSVCKSQVTWGDPLNPNFAKQWQVFANDLIKAKAIAVSRYHVHTCYWLAGVYDSTGAKNSFTTLLLRLGDSRSQKPGTIVQQI